MRQPNSDKYNTISQDDIKIPKLGRNYFDPFSNERLFGNANYWVPEMETTGKHGLYQAYKRTGLAAHLFPLPLWSRYSDFGRLK